MTGLQGMRIGCAMTGSFCTFERAFRAFAALREAGAELFPIMSGHACALDTRFGTAAAMRARFGEIAGRPVFRTIQEVEQIGPRKMLDLLLIAPCTGNTLAKLALGISDTAATMAAKSHLRNARPLLIAVSTNDGLGRSAANLGALLAMKHVFFVPFRQDDWENKPNSLVSDMAFVPDAAREALQNRQLQPLLLSAFDVSTDAGKNRQK